MAAQSDDSIKLQQINDELSQEISALQSHNAMQQREYKKVVEESETALRDNEELTFKLSQAEANLRGTTTLFISAKTANKQLTSQLQAVKTDLSAAKLKVVQLTTELDRAKKQHNDNNDEIQDLERRLAESQEAHSIVVNRQRERLETIARIERQRDEIKRQRDEIERQRDQLHVQLEALTAERDQLRVQLEEARRAERNDANAPMGVAFPQIAPSMLHLRI